LFLDSTNSSVKNVSSEKIIYENVENFQEILCNLIKFESLIIKGEIRYIVIDSLSIVANRITLNKNKDNEYINEMNTLIHKYVSEFNVGFIYISCCSRLKDKINYDMINPGKYLISKENQSNHIPNLIPTKDYILTFSSNIWSFNEEGMKNRKYYVKIQRSNNSCNDQFIMLN